MTQPIHPYERRRESDHRIERFMADTNDRLDRISGQIAEIMVRMEEDHKRLNSIDVERQYVKRWLWRAVLLLLAAELFSPHSAFFFAALKKLFGE